MKIVSFFTPGELYTQHERELRATVDEFAPLALYRTSPVMDLGSWEQNCALKPGIIRRELATLQDGDRLLYLDVDARIRAPIDELATHPGPFDVGLHVTKRHSAQPVTLSGTLLFANTRGAEQLVEHWLHRCEERPDVWDQIHLAAAIGDMAGIRVWDFGPEYVYIFDTFKKRYPKATPIIEHLQASRSGRKAKAR